MKEMIKKNVFFILLVLAVILNLTVISAVNLENNTISNDGAQITYETSYISDNNIQKDNMHSINNENTKMNNLKNTIEENPSNDNNILNITKQQKNTLKADSNEQTVTNYNGLVNAVNTAKTSTYSNYTINLLNGTYNVISKITWDPSGNCKTLIINGNNQTLNGKNNYQFININSGFTVILNNITLNNFTSGNGGAILNQGSLTITNSTLRNNVATIAGGAIYNYNSNLNIINSILINNNANVGGGAIYNYNSTINITGTTFTKNTVNDATYGGGAIYNRGTLNINNSTLKENKAKNGGAIYIYEQNKVNITDSTLLNNNADNGGAIYGSTTTTININNSNFTGNKAGSGGAIYGQLNAKIIVTNSNLTGNNASSGGAIYGQLNTKITVTNSKLTNNKATSSGGVIYAHTSSLINITDSTISNNNANYGGALYAYSNTTMNLTGSTLTNNKASYGGVIYGYPNTIINVTGSVLLNNNANVYGGTIFVEKDTTITVQNSNFTNDTASHGGAIYARQNSTIKIQNSNFTNNNATEKDEYGRLTGFGGAIYGDINSTIMIISSNLISNTAANGGAIHVESDNNLTVINSNLISNTAANGGAIHVESDNNLTVINSNLISNTAENWGGAIYASTNTKVTVTNSTLTNNIANVNSPHGVGGAIMGYSHNVIKIINSTISNNNAKYGGVVYGQSNTKITVTNSKLTNNHATSGGGAICGVMNSNIAVQNSNFTSNNATDGGAIYGNESTSINILNSYFTNNNAASGGAIYGYNGTNINVTCSTLSNNNARWGGAVYGQLNIIIVTNTNLTNNKATHNGGAIYGQSDSYLKVINNTFTNNTAGYGGAIYGYVRANITITSTNFTNNNANNSGGAVFNLYGYITITKTNFTNNTPPTWEITNNSQTYHIKLLNTDNYVPSDGIVAVYMNDKFNGNYALINGIIDDIKIPIGETTIKLVVNGTGAEKYSENTYILESNFTLDVSMNVTNTTVNQGDMAVIFMKFNDTINNGIIQISNQTNTLKNINILETTDFIVVAIDTTNFPYSDNIINVKYLIDEYMANDENTIIRIKIPTTVTANINNQTTINTSITVNVEGIEETETPTGIISVTNTTGNIIATGYLENGESIISWNNNQTGSQEFIVKYNGDNIYQENSTTVNLNILRQAIADVTVLNNTSGNVTIKVNITTDDAAPLSEKEVEITLPNSTTESVKTDENGIILIVDTTTPEGKTNIIIKVLDTSEVKGTEITSPIEIITDYQKIIDELEDFINTLNKTSVIKAIAQNGTVDNTNVIVTLENKLGTPINNAPIIIKDNQGNLIGNVSTDEDGIAVIPVKTREGTQNITITYSGNDTYTADTTTTTITTAKNNVTVTVDPVNSFFGEKITFTAYIKDTNGKSVTGGSIIFKLNGKTLRNDGRFDSNAPAWKFTVKNGKATVSINADSYLRNTKNLSATYTGSYKYNEAHSEVVTAQINKRNAQITVTATPHIQKQYETITFTAKLTDITPNHENKRIIHTNTKVLFKINGKTLTDKDGNKILIKVGANKTASYKYTVPAGMSGITADGKLRNYTVEVVLVSESYNPDARATGTFNIQRSTTTINIQNVTVNNQNKLSIQANLTDYKGNNLIGTNEVSIKVNGITYINPTTNKTQIFKVKNGIIDLKDIPITNTKTIKSVTIVTGARPAYLGQRNETTDIVKV